jgi:hypothetical protein
MTSFPNPHSYGHCYYDEEEAENKLFTTVIKKLNFSSVLIINFLVKSCKVFVSCLSKEK